MLFGSLGVALRDIPKNGCERDYKYNDFSYFFFFSGNISISVVLRAFIFYCGSPTKRATLRTSLNDSCESNVHAQFNRKFNIEE